MDPEIDLAKLKETYRADPLTYHIWSVAADCKVRSRAFWKHFTRMKRRHNWISVPLLILSSGTGVSSVAQIGGNGGATARALSVLVTVLGVSAAILTALQRYLRYSERAEESRYMAKSYARIARAIQYNMTLVESRAVVFKPEAFLKFVDGFHKDVDALLNESADVPHELLARRAAPFGWLRRRRAVPAAPAAPAPHVRVEMANAATEARDAAAATFEIPDWVRAPPGMTEMARGRPMRSPARVAEPEAVAPVTLDDIKGQISQYSAEQVRARDRAAATGAAAWLQRSPTFPRSPSLRWEDLPRRRRSRSRSRSRSPSPSPRGA